jgi:hypothetical protein
LDIDGLSKILIKICENFNRGGVDYVVGGGFAVILHGLPRVTDDIDFFVDPSSENIAKIKTALMDIYHDHAIDDIRVTDIESYSVVRYGTPEGFYLDFIGKIGEVAGYLEIKKGRVYLELEKVRIPVCGVETMLKLKEHTVRPVDQQDSIFLRAKLSRQNKKNNSTKHKK